MQSESRRLLLKALAGVVAATRFPVGFALTNRTLPDLKRAEALITHNPLPWALETRRSYFGHAPITPISDFFVRNNLPMPPTSMTAQGDNWTFAVKGCVTEGQLSVADLKRMPTTTVASVLQCSGNGRDFFSHNPAGSQWSVGAAGCALWTGVPVSEIFKRFGGTGEDVAFLTATGGEPLPEGVDPDSVSVERSVPIAKGLRDCLLAFEMNGAPLPAIHGGPLRLIVPGYFGVNNIKWVRGLAATPGESHAKIQVSGYRMRPEGVSGTPEHPSMWRMPVKSWFVGSGTEGEPILAGPNTLHGVAFSGERGIQAVELSSDGGTSWQEMRLTGPDLGPNAWRTFEARLDIPPGQHQFFSRAVDHTGDRQPEAAEANHRGYGHNGWRDHGIQVTAVEKISPSDHLPTVKEGSQPLVTVSEPKPERALSPEAAQGKRLFSDRAMPNCGVCHTLGDAQTTGAVGPNLDNLQPTLEQVRNAVGQGVGAMPAYASQLTEGEIEALAAYIVEATQ